MSKSRLSSGHSETLISVLEAAVGVLIIAVGGILMALTESKLLDGFGAALVGAGVGGLISCFFSFKVSTHFRRALEMTTFSFGGFYEPSVGISGYRYFYWKPSDPNHPDSAWRNAELNWVQYPATHFLMASFSAKDPIGVDQLYDVLLQAVRGNIVLYIVAPMPSSEPAAIAVIEAGVKKGALVGSMVHADWKRDKTISSCVLSTIPIRVDAQGIAQLENIAARVERDSGYQNTHQTISLSGKSG